MYKYMKLYKHMYIYTYMSKADPGPAPPPPFKHMGYVWRCIKTIPRPQDFYHTHWSEIPEFLDMPQHVFTESWMWFLYWGNSISNFSNYQAINWILFCFLKNQEELPIVYNSVEFNISIVFQLLFYRNNNVNLNDWMLRMIVQFNCESFLFPCSCWKILSQYENPTHIWAETRSKK